MRMEYDSPRANRTEVIYNKIQDVYCRNKNREELRRDVRISLEMLTGLSPMLCFKLTDDDDPFFYYALRLNDEDFKVLKTQQGLLVDFTHFPSQLAILLQQCSGASERFVLILEEQGGDPMLRSLQIVEKNEFKHLCHLALRVGRGSDEELKQYMAKQLQDLKAHNTKIESNLQQLESTLTHVQTDLKHKCNTIEDLKASFSEEKNKLQLEHLNALKEEHDRYAQAEHHWQRDHHRQIQELERRHSDVVADLESQILELKTMNQCNFEKLSQANSKNNELKDEMSKRQQDIALLQSELVSARKQSAVLDKDYHEKEIKSGQLQIQNGMLKEDLREKTTTISALQEQVAHLSEAKKDLQGKMTDLESLLIKKTEAAEVLSKDLMKANEILARLHNQQAELHSKVKLRTRISIEQEKVITKKEEEIAQMKMDIQKLAEKTKELEEAEKELSESLAKSKQELQDKEKSLQQNNNVITWLNRRLNEEHQKVVQSAPMHPSVQTAPPTSTPMDARGWIRSPPDVQQQASSIQNSLPAQRFTSNAQAFPHAPMEKNDKARPPTVPQPSVRHPSTYGAGDGRPRPVPTISTMDTRHLNENPALTTIAPKPRPPILTKPVAANPRPPNSAYFARPVRSTLVQHP